MSNTEMTRPPDTLVREFHQAFGFHVEDAPTVAPWRIRKERARLLAEEAAEAIAELLATEDQTRWPDQLDTTRTLVDIFTDRCDPPQRRPVLDRIAHELGDLSYVTAGGAVNNGVPLAAVVAEIHRSNMAKLGPDGKPIVDEHGKARKPEGWQRPDIAAVLAGAQRRPGIRPATYWEAWCEGSSGGSEGPHRIHLGDYTADSERDGVEIYLAESDAVVLPDGRVWCQTHLYAIPDEVCTQNRPPWGDWKHKAGDEDPALCGHCDTDLTALAATPQAVTT